MPMPPPPPPPWRPQPQPLPPSRSSCTTRSTRTTGACPGSTLQEDGSPLSGHAHRHSVSPTSTRMRQGRCVAVGSFSACIPPPPAKGHRCWMRTFACKAQAAKHR